MQNTKKCAWQRLWGALITVIVGTIGATIVQTSGGRVQIKDLRWETASGHLMSALLFIPKSATAETPAPGIVTSHGWYNNREMQDLNYIEWSRRGYVVLSIDMYGHGHSDAVSPAEWPRAGTGMYDAVKLLADLPYVERIGVSGHSNGARAANWSIKEDNQRAKPLIASALLVANDAMYTTAENEPLYTGIVAPDKRAEFTNNYGKRDVGIIAAQFDEFFFRTLNEDGTRTLPRDYIQSAYAQSFLHFGQDPAGLNQRSADTFYRQQIDGSQRIIYTPFQIHPWNHFSTEVAAQGIAYWETSFGAPNPIPASNQIWMFKAIFNLIGLVGWVMFIVAIARVLLFTEMFAPLRVDTVRKPKPLDRQGKIWFWCGSLGVAALAYIAYLNVFGWTKRTRPAFLPQAPTYFIGVWSAIIGFALISLMVLVYHLYYKKRGLDPKEAGINIGFQRLAATIGMAVVVLTCAYGVLFIADYFFQVDFRFWVLTVRTFTPDKIGIALRYAPLFLLFYVPMSVAANGFNYFQLGRRSWYNAAAVAAFTALAPAVIIVLQYTTFIATGDVFYKGISNILGIWLFPVVVILPVGAIVSRRIYLATQNPYLGGIIWGLVVPMTMASNTLTQL